jgi:hypothetical protein
MPATPFCTAGLPTPHRLSMKQEIYKTLEKLFADKSESGSAESVLTALLKKLCERLKFCFNTEKRIEEKIKRWLTAEEQTDDFAGFFYIAEESLFRTRQILVATSCRVVLFEYNLAGTLTDKSDKIWRQLVSVHLQERISTSSLELCFFEFHESIFYHNPNQFSNDPKIVSWKLDDLDREKARNCYILLKNKEISMKELRRQEHLDNKIVGGPKMPGGPPPGGGR